MKNHLCNMMMAAALMCATQASAQTATDPGEGLRAAVGSTAGTTAISWWGKAGRTYFVQTCVTLMEEDWRYLPVIESGTDAVIAWEFNNTGERGFVRLVYTDQIYTGPVGEADFDGDGLSNALEIAFLEGSDPLRNDTDGDGWADGVEAAYGGQVRNAAVNPLTTDPSQVYYWRSYDQGDLSAYDTYLASHSKKTDGTGWYDWGWIRWWRVLADIGSDDGEQAAQPDFTLRDYPMAAWFSDHSEWTDRLDLFSILWNAPGPQLPAGNTLPMQMRTETDFSGAESASMFRGWGCHWSRYRLNMAVKLPFDYEENFLALTYRYVPNPMPDMDPETSDEWILATPAVVDVRPFKLTLPKNTQQGPWNYICPMDALTNQYHVVHLVPMEIKQRIENEDGTFGDFVAVSELRPSRWRNMFRNGNESLIDDPDQIQIRLPGLRSSQETLRLKLGVTGITGKSNSISKDENDVVAAWQANDAEVMPLHLVTDSTDDNFSGLAAESTTQQDDYVGDRTHIISLGATVELKIEGSKSGDFPPIQIPVKGPDGKVEFRVFVLSPNGLGGGSQFGPISNEAAIAHEVFEQIGVSMDRLSTVTAPFPDGLPSSIPLNDSNHALTSAEVDTLVSLLPDYENKDVIDVYFLPCKLQGANGAIRSKGKYAVVLISISRTTLTLAHELGHACNLSHNTDASFWLMTGGGTIDFMSLYNSKRFSWQEERIVKSTQNAYYIPF